MSKGKDRLRQIGRRRSKNSLHKVTRYSFSGSIPLKFEYKLRRHKQRFEQIATTVVLGKLGIIAKRHLSYKRSTVKHTFLHRGFFSFQFIQLLFDVIFYLLLLLEKFSEMFPIKEFNVLVFHFINDNSIISSSQPH